MIGRGFAGGGFTKHQSSCSRGNMDAVAITIGISWTLAGLLCIGLSIPLIRGKVSRNAFYGVRFPESYQSDEAWFAINRFGGKRLALWSIPLIVVGVVSFFLPLR